MRNFLILLGTVSTVFTTTEIEAAKPRHLTDDNVCQSSSGSPAQMFQWHLEQFMKPVKDDYTRSLEDECVIDTGPDTERVAVKINLRKYVLDLCNLFRERISHSKPLLKLALYQESNRTEKIVLNAQQLKMIANYFRTYQNWMQSLCLNLNSDHFSDEHIYAKNTLDIVSGMGIQTLGGLSSYFQKTDIVQEDVLHMYQVSKGERLGFVAPEVTEHFSPLAKGLVLSEPDVFEKADFCTDSVFSNFIGLLTFFPNIFKIQEFKDEVDDFLTQSGGCIEKKWSFADINRDQRQHFLKSFPESKWLKKIKATRGHSQRLKQYIFTREAYLLAQLQKYKLTESRLKPESLALLNRIDSKTSQYTFHYMQGLPKDRKDGREYVRRMRCVEFRSLNTESIMLGINLETLPPIILIQIYSKLQILDRKLERFIDSIKSEFHHELPSDKKALDQAYEDFQMRPHDVDPKKAAERLIRKAEVKALKKATRQRKGGVKKRKKGKKSTAAASPAKDKTHIENKSKARKSRVKATKNKGLLEALSQHEHKQGFMENAKGILTALRQSNTLDELRENLVSAGSGTNLHQVEDVWSTKVNDKYRITFRTRTDESGFLRVYDIRLTAHYEGLSHIKT